MPINIAMWIERNAQVYRSKTAVQDDRRTISYAGLAMRQRQCGAALRALGVVPGDRVACLLPNGIELLEGLFGSAQIGASFVPLNWRLGEDELTFILDDCAPRVLLYEAPWRARVEALVKRCGHEMCLVEVEGLAPLAADAPALPAGALAFEAVLEAQEPLTEALVGGDDDDLMLIYTSGTTGNPKGVILTHSNVFWHTINGWALGASPDNICLVLLPLFHVGGLNGSVTPVLHMGGTVLLQRKFDPSVVLATLEEERVTGVLGVPTIYRMLADAPEFASTDLSRCEVLLSGGAPLPESLIQRYHARGLEFRQGYGLTEASPGVTGMGPGECLAKAGSAGRGLLYTEVQIVDDDANPVPTGTSGEVVVRGPNIMKGYWNRPEATAAALRNGWLHTGDVGRFDEDGFLYIVDRKKDMIISGGENIYPAEIEKLLAGHPQIQAAAVVAKPDDKWGEIPVAAIVADGPSPTPEALREYLLSRLAKYKVPRAYHFIDAIPLNASGKVIKAEVRKLLGIG